jgi:2-phosphoglycerate kinase
MRRSREKKQQSSRYQENIDDIWGLQSLLLDEADKAGITIIENWSIEDTVRATLDLVIDVLMVRFPPDPDAEQFLH